jgi:DNA modification methylase
VQPGDLWICGAHRVVCGDCTEAAVVAKVMQGEKAALSFTSPPYWVGKEYEKQKSVEEIERFIGQCAKMLAFFTREDESRIVINTSTGFTTSFDKRKKRQTLLLIDKWTNSFWDLGWNLRHVRHWLKEGQLASISAKADMIDQHCEWFLAYEDDVGQEMVFEDRIDQDEVDALLTYYNARGRGRGQELLGEYRNAKHWALRSYWDDIRGTANQDGHVAVMPLEVAERHLVIYTQREEIVLDPFLGSGTTMVAAQRLGRVCRGIEIEPSYVAVTLERMKGLGLDPVLVKEPAS